MLASPAEVQKLIRWDSPVEKVGDLPVYVDFADSVLDRDRLLVTGAGSDVARSSGRLGRLRRRLRGVAAPDGVTRRNVAVMVAALPRDAAGRSTVLVVGGGEIGLGVEQLYDDPTVQLVAFDIYASPTVQFVADGHRIPLHDAAVDGVLVQAVLEHVLEPDRVVAEIHRVLGPGGVVYAETPFLQQVHEGPYDFTRYTESGHRWLFRWFTRTESGVVTGPGVQLVWTIGALVTGLTRSRAVGKLARLAFFWLRWLDALVPADHQVDSACGVYFLGVRADRALAPAEVPGCYLGAQR